MTSGASTDITRFSTPIAGNVGGGSGDAPPPGSTPTQPPGGSNPGIATATDGFVAASTGYRFITARRGGVGTFRSIGYGLGGNPALLPPTNIATNVAGAQTTITQVLTTTPSNVTLPCGTNLNGVLTVKTATNATTYIHPANIPANFSAPTAGGGTFTGSSARALARTLPPPATGAGARAFGFLGGIFRMLPFIGAFLSLCDVASSASAEEALSTSKIFDDFFAGYSQQEKEHLFRLYSQKKFEGPGGMRQYLTETLGMDEESANNIITQLKSLPKAQEEAANDRKWNTLLTLGGLALGIAFGIATGGVGFAAWGAILTAGATGMCWGNLLNMGRKFVGTPDLGAFGRGAGRSLTFRGVNNNTYTPTATATA